MSTSSWTTMGPTRRPSSGGGLRSVHASMSTTRPPTGPGLTWSRGGLPNSPTSKSAAGFTAVSANWRPPSANSSPPTTKPPSLSFGPKPPTKSSPASLATPNALSPPNPGNLSHEPLGQETRYNPNKYRFVGNFEVDEHFSCANGDHPARWSPDESPCPVHRHNFKACFL